MKPRLCAYGTGASHPNGTVVNVADTLRQAEMIESEQLEVGIKHQVEGTGLQINVALFDITMNNQTIDDPDSADRRTSFSSTSRHPKASRSDLLTRHRTHSRCTATWPSAPKPYGRDADQYAREHLQPRSRLEYRRRRPHHCRRPLRRRARCRLPDADSVVYRRRRFCALEPQRRYRPRGEGGQRFR